MDDKFKKALYRLQNIAKEEGWDKEVAESQKASGTNRPSEAEQIGRERLLSGSRYTAAKERFSKEATSTDYFDQNYRYVLANGTKEEKEAFRDTYHSFVATEAYERELDDFHKRMKTAINSGAFNSADEAVNFIFNNADGSSRTPFLDKMEVEPLHEIKFDKDALEQSIRLQWDTKWVGDNAAKNGEALKLAVNAEKIAETNANGSLLDDSTIPKRGVMSSRQNIYNTPPADIYSEGRLWAGGRSIVDTTYERAQKKLEEKTANMVVGEKEPTVMIADTDGTAKRFQEGYKPAEVDEAVLPEALHWNPVKAPSMTKEELYAGIDEALYNNDYRTACQYQFQLIEGAVKQSGDEYIQDMVHSEGSQKATAALMQMAIEGDLPRAMMDSELRAELTDYALTIEEAYDIDPGFADKAAAYLDEAFGGALTDTSDNEGIGIWKTALAAVAQGGAKFNKALADFGASALLFYNKYAEGVNGIFNNTFGKLAGIKIHNGAEDLLEKGATALTGAAEAQVSKVDTYLRENATTAEYFVASAGSEMVKMAGTMAASAVAGGSVLAGSMDKLKTAQDVVKLENLGRMASLGVFAAESGSAETVSTFKETGDSNKALLAGATMAAMTMATSNLDLVDNMSTVVGNLTGSLKAAPAAGVTSAWKRWGTNGLMYVGNILKTGFSEAVQEVSENALSTPVIDFIKGENFFNRDFKAYGQELTVDAIMGFVGSLGNSIAAFPSTSKTVKVAESNMKASTVTPDGLVAQMQAMSDDLADENIRQQVQERADKMAIDQRAMEIIGSGTVDTGAMEAAGKSVSKASQRYESAKMAYENARQKLASATRKMNENPADPKALNAVMAAADTAEQAKATENDAMNGLREANREYENAKATMQNTVMEQARQEVNAAKEQGVIAQQERSVLKASERFASENPLREENLYQQSLNLADYSEVKEPLTAQEIYKLENSTKREARQIVTGLIQKFGITKRYSNANADIEFEFSGNSAGESMHKQTARGNSMADYGKMLANMDAVVSNAVPVEVHADKYKGTEREDRTLERVYVLLSAYKDGSSIVPVQLEVKEFKDKENSLYVAVTLKKTEAADLGVSLPTSETERTSDPTATSVISIPDMVAKINPSDGEFLKYIPDGMLTEEQIESKYRALGKDARQTSQISKTQVPAQTVRTGNRSSGKVVNPVDSAKKLANALGVGEFIGTRKMNNLPAAVLGYYQNHDRYLAVRSQQAGNVTVTMHEIGHAISRRINLTGTADMVNSLDPAFAHAYPAEELPGEAFAEFIWRYMVDSVEAENFAGSGFVSRFEQELRRNGIANAVHEARDEVRSFVNASASQRMGAMIADRSIKRETPIKERLRNALQEHVDSTSGAESVNAFVRRQNNGELAAEDNLRNDLLMANTAERRAWNILTGSGITDANWTITGRSLADRLDDVSKNTGRINFDELNKYMLALHSLDRDRQGLPVFDESITPAQRQDYITSIEQRYPQIVEAEHVIHEFWHEVMQNFMVDTGYMTEETLALFESMYPHYVPTNRVKDGAPRNGNRNTFTIRRATGSTEVIYNPMDSLVQNLNSIVNMVSRNNAALTFDRLYHQYEGLGIFGREVTQDIQRESVNTEDLQRQVREILENENLEEDPLNAVLEAIGQEQVEYRGTGGVNLQNVITVQRPDGGRAFYQITDMPLYNALAGTRDNGRSILDYVGRLTRGMSALTTGSNPIFGIRNFMRDFQKSVNYGSWASNYATGFAKWLRSAYDVWRETGEYNDYKALGGGGWNRIDAGTQKGATEYRSELFRGYNTSNAGRTAAYIGKKIWNAVTLNRLNEVVEQTSRYAEYKYGSQDKTTAAGREQAFLNAQESTVDFSRSGNSRIAQDLKRIIPFFNASAQGVYQVGREFLSESERDRLAPRFAKTVASTVITSALSAALLMKHLTDEEKEEYALLSDDLKAEHIFIPNFAPEVFGDAPLIRIPLSQDPLARAVHGFMSNALWKEELDEPVIEAGVIASNILDGFNPFSNGTIFDTINAINTNTNWYGSNIVPTRMESWAPTTQYTEETAELFKSASMFISGLTYGNAKVSPMMLEYIAQQYSGFLGQIVIPAISKDKSGEMVGVDAVIAKVRSTLTSDPLKSNDVVSSFYDGRDMLESVKAAATNTREMNMLRRGISEDEARFAADEAKEMLSSNGIIGSTASLITDKYNEIDEINANAELSDAQKYQLTSSVRRDMIEACLDANEAIGAYREKYVDGENFITSYLEGFVPGTVGRVSTNYETLPEVFQKDKDKSYMKKAEEVWAETGKSSHLPNINLSFKSDKKEYVVEEKYVSGFENAYRKAYQNYVDSNDNGWESMSAEEKQKVLEDANRRADGYSKNWYLAQKGNKDAASSIAKYDMQDSVSAGKYDSLSSYVSKARSLGVENGSIKSAITNVMKPIYKKMNETQRKKIREILYKTGIYDKYNFEANWLKK